MRMRIHLATVSAGIFIMLIASPVLAQMGHGMGAGPNMAAGGSGFMGMGAQLTPQQQQTLRNIQAAHQDAFAGIMKKLWAKQVQLEAALTEDKIDQAKINSLVSDINKLRSSLFEEQVKMRVELSKAGLAYYTMRGGGMMGRGMGSGMMGTGMMGSCPMMGSDPSGGMIDPEQ